MAEELKVSAASDFGPAERLMALPVPGPGGRKLVVKITAAPLSELIPLLKGLPMAGRDKDAEAEARERDPFESIGEFVAKYEERAKEIVTRYLIEPAISFEGPRADAVDWKTLHLQNQIAIVNAIARFSQDGSPEAELATFPALNGRGAGGRGEAGGTESAPEAAAQPPS